jgi:hypothetical protein
LFCTNGAVFNIAKDFRAAGSTVMVKNAATTPSGNITRGKVFLEVVKDL